jgi:hypothetical protein
VGGILVVEVVWEMTCRAVIAWRARTSEPDSSTDAFLLTLPTTPAAPLPQWTYGFGAQHIPQQDIVLGNGDGWGVAGEQFGRIHVPLAFSGQIIPLDG